MGASVERASNSLVTWTQVVYGLHAFSLLTGIHGTATVVGAFITEVGPKIRTGR